MVAIGRALMARPKLLMLDEPSMGLAPIFVEKIFEIDPRDQHAGDDDPPRRAERADGARRGQPRLRAGDRADRARGRREEAPRERAGAQDVPRRDLDPGGLPIDSSPGGDGQAPTRPVAERSRPCPAPDSSLPWSLALSRSPSRSQAAAAARTAPRAPRPRRRRPHHAASTSPSSLVPTAIRVQGIARRRRRRDLRAERVRRLQRSHRHRHGRRPRPGARHRSRAEGKTVNASFDTIIPGLAAGKYDLGMSSFTDTKAREKVVDFVTYFSAGTSFYVKAAGGPDHQRARRPLRAQGRRGARDDPGGRRQRAGGEVQVRGNPGVTVLVFPDQNAANLAIASGRSEVGMADSPSPPTSSSSRTASSSSSERPTARRRTASRSRRATGWPAVLAGIKALMANGTYDTILRSGVSSRARSRTRRSTGRRARAFRRRSPRPTETPASPPEEIKAIPVRHPGRWLAAAIVAYWRHGRRLGGHEPPLPVGSRPPLPLRPPCPSGVPGHARADRGVDGDRDRARGRARGDAPLAEPARLRCELDLHLAVPRHARLRPDPALVQHHGALPAPRARDPVRPRIRPRGRATR